MFSVPLEAQNILKNDFGFVETDSIIFFPNNDSLFKPLDSNKSTLKKSLRAGRTLKTEEEYLERTCIRYVFESISDSVRKNKDVIFYNEEGNSVSSISYLWDQNKNDWIKTFLQNETYVDTCYTRSLFEWDTLNNEWIGNEKNEFFYDDLGNLTSTVWSIRDTLNNEWVGFWKQLYFYDQDGKDTLLMAYTWGTLWNLNHKIETQYDDFGNMITEELYYWNISLNEWETYTKKEQIFDDDGKLTFYLYYAWNDEKTSFDCHNKLEYEYDNYGNLILLLQYNWHVYPMSGEDKLEEEGKEEFSYDGEGNVILKMSYLWDHDTNVWIVYLKEEYEYSDSGELLILISHALVHGTNEWQLFKRENLKDEKGNDITIFYDWNSIENAWIRSGLLINPNYYNTECDLTYTNLAEYKWDVSVSAWIPLYKVFCDCKTSEYITVGITENPQQNIALYPNPTESYVQINGLSQIATVSMYTLQGRLVLRQQVFNEKFSIESLQAGIYILMLNYSNENVLKRRIIKL